MTIVRLALLTISAALMCGMTTRVFVAQLRHRPLPSKWQFFGSLALALCILGVVITTM